VEVSFQVRAECRRNILDRKSRWHLRLHAASTPPFCRYQTAATWLCFLRIFPLDHHLRRFLVSRCLGIKHLRSFPIPQVRLTAYSLSYQLTETQRLSLVTLPLFNPSTATPSIASGTYISSMPKSRTKSWRKDGRAIRMESSSSCVLLAIFPQ
jgi:hypothetical protein